METFEVPLAADPTGYRREGHVGLACVSRDVFENLVAVLYFPQYSKFFSFPISCGQLQTLGTELGTPGHGSGVLLLHGSGNLHPGLLIRAGRDFSA